MLWLWVLTTFSPPCESSIRKTYLVHGFRDSACSGWLFGDRGSAAVDRRRRVMETDASCYGSWEAEGHRQRKVPGDQADLPRAHPAGTFFFPLLKDAIIGTYPGKMLWWTQTLLIHLPLSARIKFQYLNILGDIFKSKTITVVIQDMKIPWEMGWRGSDRGAPYSGWASVCLWGQASQSLLVL